MDPKDSLLGNLIMSVVPLMGYRSIIVANRRWNIEGEHLLQIFPQNTYFLSVQII